MNDGLLPEIKYDPQGLVPAVVQDAMSGEVLMVAYMNAESIRRSLETGFTHFWSRSRQKFWMKGESSGHVQRIRSLHYDCDADCLLVGVDQTGPACHTNERSCFYRAMGPFSGGGPYRATAGSLGIFHDIEAVIADRRRNPREGSHVAALLAAGPTAIAGKVLEESAETVEAYREKKVDQVRYEAADLLFHLLVLLEDAGLRLDDVAEELRRRFGNPPKKEPVEG